MTAEAQRVFIAFDGQRVSGLFLSPQHARACFVFAHGAGAGMEHAFMTAVANDLADAGVATLRYQFPYMERGLKRTDAPAVCHSTVRAAVAEAARLGANLPLIAGGRSFGGRMTSQAQALAPLPNVHGLAFFGFPLHPAGRPSVERAEHLFKVNIPMLFAQGTRDALADLTLLEPLIARLGSQVTLKLLSNADHSFNVPARSGRTSAAVRAEAIEAFATWLNELA